MLQLDLRDYSDAYIVVKGTINLEETNKRDRKNRIFVLKNNVPFISCISKINGTLIDDAEDLDVVMPTYNLIEYSKNYRKTTGSLWNCYRDELNDDTKDNNSPNKKVIESKSIKHKTSITGSTIDYNIDEKITNAEGNEIDNPAHDAKKNWHERSRSCCSIKLFEQFLENFRYVID